MSPTSLGRPKILIFFHFRHPQGGKHRFVFLWSVRFYVKSKLVTLALLSFRNKSNHLYLPWKSSIIVVPHRSMNSGLEKEVPVAAKLETNLDKVVTEFFRYGCSLFGYDGVFVHADDVSCKKKGQKMSKIRSRQKKKKVHM